MISLMEDLHAGMRIRKAHIFSLLADMDLDGKHVLDAGCGRGDYSFYLAHRFPGANITAVDLDSVQIELNQIKAGQLKLKNLKFVQGDLVHLRLPDEYDLILSVDVFEHIEDDINALRSLYSLLSGNGILMLHVPLANRVSILNTRYEFQIQNDHARDGYVEKDLLQKLEQVKLQVIDKRYTFGKFGTAAWEIYKVAGGISRVLQLLTIVSTMVLTWFETHFQISRGNSVLVLARK